MEMSAVTSNRFPGAPKDTRTRMSITFGSADHIVVCGIAGDVCLSITRAAVRARGDVARLVSRMRADKERATPVRSRRRHIEDSGCARHGNVHVTYNIQSLGRPRKRTSSST